MGMNSDVTKAMILAAGEGTRLRPLTSDTPKVLLPVGGKPLIEYQLFWLKSHGISQVVINLYHLGEKIKDFLGDGSRFGLEISYSNEETLLGTAGGVKKMEPFFDSTFIVLNGDTLADFDLGAMLRFHRTKNSLATLAILGVPNPSEVGIVEIDGGGRILSFVEKPPRGSETSNLMNGGIYVFEKEAFSYIPEEGISDFAYDIFPKLLELALPVYAYSLKPGDYLIDIGTMEKYSQANEDMKLGKVKIAHGQQSCIS